MPPLDRRCFELIELLHGEAGEAATWSRFLAALRGAISPDAAVVLVTQPRGQLPGSLLGSGIDAMSLDGGHFLLPTRVPTLGDAPLGVAREIRADDPDLAGDLLFCELLEPAGVLPGPGLFVVTERSVDEVHSALLVLARASGWKPSAADRALLEALAPHLVIARRLQLQLAQRGREIDALIAAFDQLVLGVVFVDERQRVSYANRSAAAMLGVRAGFSLPEILAAAFPDRRTRALAWLVDDKLKDGAQIRARPKDGQLLQVLASPFRWRRDDGLQQLRFARALFIGDPRQRTGDPSGVLREVYGLTRSETRLALLLTSGCSVDEAAGLLRISTSTARSVLKKVFLKTGANRQAALVHQLHAVFGQVQPDPSGQAQPGPTDVEVP